ncbi:dynein axonemal heavy chain 8-like isoform X2 [Paramacrobiotus metropolitanus]|nr:dynein axonemal heavy chain 8-like isoform X2 [Paramacrobiotus metropolitanus]
MLMGRISNALLPEGKDQLFDQDYLSAVEILRECDTAVQLYLQTTAQFGNLIFSSHNFDQLRLLGVRIKKVARIFQHFVDYLKLWNMHVVGMDPALHWMESAFYQLKQRLKEIFNVENQDFMNDSKEFSNFFHVASIHAWKLFSAIFESSRTTSESLDLGTRIRTLSKHQRLLLMQYWDPSQVIRLNGTTLAFESGDIGKKMPKYSATNANFAWYCEFNAALARHHLNCLEIVDKMCQLSAFADEHAAYMHKLTSYKGLCETYWTRRTYWMTRGLVDALRTSIFVRTTSLEKLNPAKGMRLNLNNELLQVLDDQRFITQNKLPAQPESALNYFLSVHPTELSRMMEEFVRRLVNLQSRGPATMKDVLLVGSSKVNAVLHLGLTRFKWKNVMSEFTDLFPKIMRDLRIAEYLHAKAVITYHSKVESVCHHLAELNVSCFPEIGSWDAAEFSDILPIWFSHIVHHLEHASATAELALCHASHLCATIAAPKRVEWDKRIPPRWNVPIVPRSSHSRHSVWEEAEEDGKIGEAFHVAASSALISYDQLIFHILERVTISAVQFLLDKLVPFHRGFQLPWWQKLFGHKEPRQDNEKHPHGSHHDEPHAGPVPMPFFQVSVAVVNGKVTTVPPVSEAQRAAQLATLSVVKIRDQITSWGKRHMDGTIDAVFKDPSNDGYLERAPADQATFLEDIIKLDETVKAEKAETRQKQYVVRDYMMVCDSFISSVEETYKLLPECVALYLEKYEFLAPLFSSHKDVIVRDFQSKKPTMSDYRHLLDYLRSLEEKIDELNSYEIVYCIAVDTHFLKQSAQKEIQEWRASVARALKTQSSGSLKEITNFLDEQAKVLQTPAKDVESAKKILVALDLIRDKEVDVDSLISPIEEAFYTIQSFGIALPKAEIEAVDTLRYNFAKVIEKSHEMQTELLSMQPILKTEVVDGFKKFHYDSIEYVSDYDQNGPMQPGLTPAEASERLNIYQTRFDDLYRRYVIYSGGLEVFGQETSEYPELQRIKKELFLLQKLYGLYNLVMQRINNYFEIPWENLNLDAINQELQDLQARCKKLPKGMKDWKAFEDLKKKIDDFTEVVPTLEAMTNKAMKDRHWVRISTLTGHHFDMEMDSKNLLLKDIMKAPILKYKDEIEDICISATKEKDIEAKLKGVIDMWSGQSIKFAPYKGKADALVKGGDMVEIITMLEDSLMVLGSLMTNRYNVPFKKEIQSWVQKLSTTSEIVETWLAVQNLWVYLEAVFVGGDIAKQLPKEAKRFQSIDKTWQKIMQRAKENPSVIPCCVGDETMQETLPQLMEQLELCQKSLTGYLEAKRLVFPRFFFVSDPVLLEILGQASDSHTIQPYLLSCFDNVNEVAFSDREYDRITTVISREGERVALEQDVLARGGVEMWLGELLKEQMRSLHGVIRDANRAMTLPSYELMSFQQAFIAQVGLLGIQLYWTRMAEAALKNARVDKMIMKTTNTLFLTMLNKLIEKTTHNLTKNERIKFETLITIHVHQRDIFDELVRLDCRSVSDFAWLKQARFYFQDDVDQTIVSITDVDFIYQNEFLGCTDRLVITPLTDRCYITLAQALGMHMGGAPAGPAGTGKTETTKDMGKALGKYVVVFNCSDQMDFRGLGRIYKGLAQSGSWGCFDEFNRIELPVLSVAAQQIYIVLSAKKEKKKEFIFSDGDRVPLNPEFGIFLTMNPGYAGRQELPENLKIQFRTVAMMVPDRQIIMRVKLASCGFQENVILAQKFYVLYKLCEEQLSKQVHYDWGLRNILSVLRTLGAQKRSRPQDTEQAIVMRVLRDMNLSKLVDEDEPLFNSLINDLFPGFNLDSNTYVDLQKAIANQCEQANLVNHPPWNLKVVQLFETQRVRHGMMALGPSGSGKTTCITVLMKAMTEMGNPHKEMRMNPKAITASQMFGRLDVATNDWTDGIFSTLWRRSLKAKKNEHVWIVLDGPIDAIWIENLNSVLDDNKTLTLANGDRIPMSPTCKIVFEPDNVNNASPATVSRNGMVFMSSSVLTWKPIMQAWLKSQFKGDVPTLMGFFEKIFDDVKDFVASKTVPKIKVLECNFIKQALDILLGLIQIRGLQSKLSYASLLKQENTQISHTEKMVLLSVLWSFGAIMELNDRTKLQEFFASKVSAWGLQSTVGEMRQLFDLIVDKQGNWQPWSARVEEYMYPEDSIPEYRNILVPNVDNVRTTFMMDLLAKQSKSVLLIGEQGTAKTVMVMSYMKQYDPEVHSFKSLNFSSATTPMMFQRIIESYVDKRIGTIYGPPGGKKLTVFIDDVSMPVVNEWGDQVTNEIVRQLIEMKGFYSLDKPGEFTTILDLQYVAGMNHPGGGRNDIPPRLKRQFSIFNCTIPTDSSMDKIFGVISGGHFCRARYPNLDIWSDTLKQLVPATRMLWQATKAKMLPTPAKFHYVFNLRDLSRIWEGILKVTYEQLNSVEDLAALWKFECTRVIADRFITQEDKTWFEQKLVSIAQTKLGDRISNFLAGYQPYFVNFLRDAPEPTGEEAEGAVLEAPKLYEQVKGLGEARERLMYFMRMYNENVRGGRLDLVFFEDAIINLVKISRIINTPGGHALLVGVGGSGKQSLTKLASFIAGYSVFQITLTRSYNVTNLMDDLKQLYRMSGGPAGKGISFIFTDNDVKDESFLEYLNNILKGGEPSQLFSREELDEICQELVATMKKEFPKRPPSGENLYEYFSSRAKKNLHVVLCFSPVGGKFRARSLKFPGLISGCTINWFTKWPRDALVAVSKHFISAFPIECTPAVKQQVIEAMGAIHDAVSQTCTEYFQRFRRATHVTPKSFLSFVDIYKLVYKSKVALFLDLADRMKLGLEKLIEAGESVAQLSKDLVLKERDLAVASAKAEKVLSEVAIKAESANKVKVAVQEQKDKAQVIKDVISVEKAAAEKMLEEAKPLLERAEEALKTIAPAAIATVRKLAKPPFLVMKIMDCCLILFQKRLDPVAWDAEKQFIKPSWGEALKVMSGNFLGMLQNFDRDLINEETVDLMAPYINSSNYNKAEAMRSAGDVVGLLLWTVAMSDFYWINRKVLPLKAALVLKERKLNEATQQLEEAQKKLDEKQAELDVVQTVYDKAMGEKKALMDDAALCRLKMSAANTLIGMLGGERVRWTSQSKEYRAQIERLVGDVLICTAFLSYAGPFNQEFRQILRRQWQKDIEVRKIPLSDDLNITTMLIDEATIEFWALQGLPNDDLSVQNGIIVTQSSRYPLLIDPQQQGKNWIKNREKENNLVVSTLNHKYFRQHLEDALSLGKPMLLEDVEEEFDPVLDNVLDKNYIKSGTTYKVKIGDKEVDVMAGFKMYITTKLPNPSYTPEMSARSAIIDFTVTSKGLEDQLLGRVILTEKKELEAERTKLMEDVAANKNKQLKLEENLLYKLTSIKGSLVDDPTLIDVLKITKQTASEVSAKLIIADQTRKKINNAREEYRPVASRGSILYFLISEMTMVNVMYQVSLKQFLGLFDLSMAKAQKSTNVSARVQAIIETLTLTTFRYTCRGLYERHKFLFTILLALKTDLQKGAVTYDEFQVFIKGGATVTPDPQIEKLRPKWIIPVTWSNLQALVKLSFYRDVVRHVAEHEKQWRGWFDKEAPENESFPHENYNGLDVFKKFLLIRSFCPDRTIAMARKYIADSLGRAFADPVVLNLEATWAESDPRVPLICFLSMGSDPTNQIEALSKKLEVPFAAISMGQGQEIHARALLRHSLEHGGWVLLQNCHLGLDFMDELVETVVLAEKSFPTFRLWITTEPHSRFSITLLQASIKFTNDPPAGLKAGLKRTYAGVSQDWLDLLASPYWKPLIYGVSYLHSVVQERRKFGPLGWCIPYEFNSADWYASCLFVQHHLEDLDPKKPVSFQTVRYMLGEVQYGGRVTDDFDKRLLNTFARVWFGEEMFDTKFAFSTGYKIPRCRTVQEYLEAIEQLPPVDSPLAFGLHRNADITYQTSFAIDIFDTIISIQPKESSGGAGKTREEIVREKSEEMLQQLPKDYNQFEMRERLEKMGKNMPMNIFLRQEVDRMQKIISAVRTTLQDLKLAIDGTIIMNEILRDALDNMFDGRVPALWKKLSWEATTLSFWFAELLERNVQFVSWLFEARPSVFWMTGFFNPQGFLTAMRQEVARANKGWALDTVVLHNEITKLYKEDVKSGPDSGVYVYGLFLDGASWDKKNARLVESAPKVLFTALPVAYVFAVNGDPLKGLKTPLYRCPVYKKPRRTDLTFITGLWLEPGSLTPDLWTLRGVALLCDTK